jgi:GNAT superfamily N-acetyltransferase
MGDMVLTLSEVAEKPALVTYNIGLKNGEQLLLRPLIVQDVHLLVGFLKGLSIETRRLSTFDGYGLEQARALIDAINRYDKLRLVVQNAQQRIVGLIEFSFDLPDRDRERFNKSGVRLNKDHDCRFGPTLADDYQSKGLGSGLFPLINEIALRFGKDRIILWGGVLTNNIRAINYYEKHGFKKLKTYVDSDGMEKLDMILELDKNS